MAEMTMSRGRAAVKAMPAAIAQARELATCTVDDFDDVTPEEAGKLFHGLCQLKYQIGEGVRNIARLMARMEGADVDEPAEVQAC